MPVISNPTYLPTSGYRPVEWVTSVTTLAANIVEWAVVEVFFNAVKVAEFKKAPFSSVSGGAVITYGFKLDPQAIFQNLKAPIAQSIKSSIFGPLGAGYSFDNTDFYTSINLSVSYLFRNSTTGLLEPVPAATDVTLATPTFVAARQQAEDQSLKPAYFPDPLNLAPAKFLTNSPGTQDICLDESLFISIIGGLGNALRVTTFDAAGIAIDEGIFSSPISGVNSQETFGIGPNEIRATVWDLAGAVNIDNPLVASYRVTFGSYGPPFVPLSESKFYTLVDCCEERATRLHFFNLLGGADAYTFKSLRIVSVETKSGRAQKPLGWDFTLPSPHNVSDKGRFKIDSQADDIYQIESTFLEPDAAQWLCELLSSPEVYLEQGGDLLAIVIDDTTQEIETSETSAIQLVRFSVTFRLANSRVIQRA